MSDDCECPLLAAYAETEKMLEFGLQRGYGGPPLAIMAGQLRGERGCPGPQRGFCHWHRLLLMMLGDAPQPRPDVPLVTGGRAADRRALPGQLL